MSKSLKVVSWVLIGVGIVLLALSANYPGWSDPERVVQDWEESRDAVGVAELVIFLGICLRLHDGGWRVPMLGLLLSFIYSNLFPNVTAFFHLSSSEGWWQVQRHCLERSVVAALPTLMLLFARLEGDETGE